MSQLAVRPGRNAAREAKRLKEVRKVKGAIVWTEREREKRQKLATERWEAKQAHQGLQRWEKEQVRDVRTAALRNAKEDWRLGPLRPNRAIGKAGEKYGALSGQALQTPDIPVHASKSRNEARARRGLELEYPLVVDDKKYFPFVKDDRVVVIKGREKGKIGVIQSVNDRTHGVFLTGLNMHYYDADVFGLSGDGGGAKRANEVPIPIEDLRLVVPYEMTEKRVVYDADGQELEKPIKYYTDVIVDKIFMERHTTGIDPFDGTNYGDQEIPKEHQYDPQTGLPIFHRYIAGTKHRLDWPWEKEEVEEDASALATAQATAPEKKSLFQKIRHPIQTVKSWKTKDTAAVTAAKETEENLSERLDEIEQEVIQARRTEAPTSQDPKFPNAYDVTDTTRNIIEAPANVHYTILSTPFPPTLGEELRGYMQEYTAESRKKDKDDGVEAPAKKRAKHRTERALVASQMSKAKHAAAQQMKTPMQVRWETERAKKVKKAPLVSTDELVRKLSEYRMTKRGVKVEELD